MTTIPPFFDYNSTTDPIVLTAGTEADAIVDDFYGNEWGAPELHSLIATAIIDAELRGRATAQADAARLQTEVERVKAERDHYLAEWTAELEGGLALRKHLGAQAEETIWQAAERVVADAARLRAALESTTGALLPFKDTASWVPGVLAVACAAPEGETL